MQLTDQQLSAVDMVKNNRISVLTGGPGTGKTTTAKEIITWAEGRGMTVDLCAPSGKASKRLNESTGRSASTIHRLLGAQMTKEGFEFFHGELTPLDTDLIICDETSMVSNDLMASLLRAINPDRTRILFLGDDDQLPSVGAGAVLRDLLASGVVPHVKLDKIHRSSGDIVRACHNIKHGKYYEPSAILDPENGLNLRHIEAPTPMKIVSAINKIVTVRMPQRGFDPVWDVQVISPTNTKTAMSCKGINEVLQEKLNQKYDKYGPGDKVINTKNREIDGEYMVNGDIGHILREVKSGYEIEFFDPERIVNISKIDNNLLLAYCITCHRFQGSESPVIVIPVHSSFAFLVNRTWIYTAISRAKTICITVGQFSEIKKAIGRANSSERVTMLKKKLSEDGREDCRF